MKKRAKKLASLCLTAGILFSGTMSGYAKESTGADAKYTAERSITGQLVFAKCEEYINIRANADLESEITAKIYNNGAATVIGQVGDWYEITSGNARGYAKAEYFVTGEKAQELAKALAYNVATVHPEELNIRTGPGEEYDTKGIAYQKEELEVVDYSSDWMKVALGGNEYGYVNAYYVAYDTYYPVAETMDEEQARLQAEHEALLAAQREQEKSCSETEAPLPEESWSETEVPLPEESWSETEAPLPEESWFETEAPLPEESWSETEAPLPEESWSETEAPLPEESWSETEAPLPEESWSETEAPLPEESWSETEAPLPEESWSETEAPLPEESWSETEAPLPEESWSETEAPLPEESWSETETPSYPSTGQSLADYAVQFVGNPYVWGGTSLTNGADCSGFVQSVFANFGIRLARTAADQSYGGTNVSFDQLQAGDLIFYGSTGIDHVALYIGGGQIVHAANSKSGIILSDCYYNTPVCARRYW